MAEHRERLRADCARCMGLCCVVPAFSASADFAIDKPARTPCPNLNPDFRCGIHNRLREQGFPGCTVYDCFGAGQQVTQVTFGGQTWRDRPDLAGAMFTAYTVMRQVHELLWHLHEALTMPAAAPVRSDLRRAVADLEALAGQPSDVVTAADLSAHWTGANELLVRVSERARAALRRPGQDRRRADLIGADLAGADLKGCNLRGALLIGANLRSADLRLADVTGADLRGADLGGANLTDALFLIQAQLDSANGDRDTRIPAALRRPSHWR